MEKYERVQYEYEKKFPNNPPVRFIGSTLSDEEYIKRMEKAIKRGKPLTKEELGSDYKKLKEKHGKQILI